jgi:hypothetical protein
LIHPERASSGHEGSGPDCNKRCILGIIFFTKTIDVKKQRCRLACPNLIHDDHSQALYKVSKGCQHAWGYQTAPSCRLKLHCIATTLHHCSNATRAIERKQVRVRDSGYPASPVSLGCRVVFTGVHGEKTTRLRSAMVVSHTFLGWGGNGKRPPSKPRRALAAPSQR